MYAFPEKHARVSEKTWRCFRWKGIFNTKLCVLIRCVRMIRLSGIISKYIKFLIIF